MKYIKQINELFDSKDFYPFERSLKNEFHFETENNWEYKVGFHQHEDYYFVGFKAKRPDDFYMNFDFDILTNDNIIKVLNTIVEIIKQHQNKFKVTKYCFSTSSNEKSLANKRASVYKKIIEKIPGWKITRDEENNKYYITPSSF